MRAQLGCSAPVGAAYPERGNRAWAVACPLRGRLGTGAAIVAFSRWEVRMRTMVLAAAACSLIACVDSPSTARTTQRLVTHNRLAGNRLAGNALDSTRLTALADTAGILSNHSGRIVYSYLISCALPEGVMISAAGVVDDSCESDPTDPAYACTVGGSASDAYCSNGTCTFSGGVGVAPKWVDHKLDSAGQGWVSACVFARVNAHDTAEAISLRGSNPALTISVPESETYTAEEGAFYGNLFTDAPDVDWNACSGENNGVAHDQLRECATENPATPGKTYCDFNYTGPCRDFTPDFPSAYACSTFTGTGGFYGDCHAAAAVNGKWKGSKVYREVITTYVAQ
jgi:hypothetical protein